MKNELWEATKNALLLPMVEQVQKMEEKTTRLLELNVLGDNNECWEIGCHNKVYGYDHITPNLCVPLCRKHYRMYCLSWSEYEATRGKRT